MGFRDRLSGLLGRNQPAPATLAGAPELRAPAAGVVPVRWSGRGMPVPAEWDGVRAIQQGFYANVFVYAAVRARARARAGLPIRIGPDPDRPSDYNPNHPVLLALRSNPSLGARTLISHASAQLDVVGKFAWEADLDSRDRPVAFWPLAGHLILPVLATSGAQAARTGYFAGFEYRANGDGGGFRRLRADRTVYVYRPRQDDLTQPESLLQAARLNVDVARYLDTYNLAFLRNDARPAAAVITPRFSTDEEYRRFQQQWADEYGGPRNAGKPVFIEHDGETADGTADLSGALRIETLGLTQRDAQLVDQYQQQLRAICVAFSVPLSVLGDAANRTFSNAGEEHAVFWEALRADTDELAESLEQQLRPWLGSDRIWFDYSKVEALRPPARVTTPGIRDLAAVGAITVNEARDLAGLPPVPDGDQLLPADTAGQDLVAEVSATEPVVVSGGEFTDEAAAALIARVEELVAQRHTPPPAEQPQAPPVVEPARLVEDRAQAGRDRRARRAREVDQLVSRLEADWERELRALFARQETSTLERLRGKRGRQLLRETLTSGPDVRVNIARVFDLDYWIAQTRAIVAPLFSAPIGTAAARVVALLSSPPEINDVVDRLVDERARRVAEQINRTTADQLAEQLVEGVQNEDDIDDLANRVLTVFNGATRVRATTIARTEVLSAFNEASYEVGRRSPTDLPGKEWIAADDPRTRPSHAAADGQIVDAAEPFRVGVAFLQHPGDPAGGPEEVINCRCSLGFLTAEEMEDEAERAARTELRGAVPVLAAHRLIDQLASGELAYDALPGRIEEVAA